MTYGLLSNQQKLDNVKHQAFQALITSAMCIAMVPMGVHADAIESAIEMILKVLRTVSFSAGALLLVVGAIQYAMSLSEDGGPKQQKALMQFVGGIALIVIGGMVMAFQGSIVEIIRNASA